MWCTWIGHENGILLTMYETFKGSTLYTAILSHMGSAICNFRVYKTTADWFTNQQLFDFKRIDQSQVAIQALLISILSCSELPWLRKCKILNFLHFCKPFFSNEYNITEICT